MRITRSTLADACAFVARIHRHHEPPVGHRFSLAAHHDGKVVGVAIVGRPVSKAFDPERVLEVSRLATDGTKNSCSALYGAAARAGKALGFERIQTYTLESEPGTSLIAAGWTRETLTTGGQWDRPGDWNAPDQLVMFARNRTDQPTDRKWRWAKVLNEPTNPTPAPREARRRWR